MLLKAVRFLNLLLVALTLGMAFSHALEYPGKQSQTGADWLMLGLVQRGFLGAGAAGGERVKSIIQKFVDGAGEQTARAASRCRLPVTIKDDVDVGMIEHATEHGRITIAGHGLMSILEISVVTADRNRYARSRSAAAAAARWPRARADEVAPRDSTTGSGGTAA